MSKESRRTYRQSGHAWIGNIPSEWQVGRLRWLSRRYAGGTPDRKNQSFWENGTIPWLNSGAVNQSIITQPSAFITEDAYNSSSARWIPEGSLVMALAGQGKTKGMVAQLAIATTCNQSMAAILPFGMLSSRFLFWWLTANYQNIRNLAGGDDRDGLNLELVGDIGIPLPPCPEQVAIAAFLDCETAKIDALVREQQRLIELLKEKRQAVISYAVNRGLDPNVAMTSSGVEWLGDVPGHWEVLRLKRVSPEITVGIVVEPSKYYADDGVPALRSLNVRPGAVEMTDCVFISAESNDLLKKSRLRSGDLVAVRTGQPGTTAVIPPELDGCNCIDLIIIRKPKSGSERYLCWYLGSDLAVRQFAEGSGGAIQQHFNVGTAMDLIVTWPSESDQEAIATYLEGVTSRIDGLSADAQIAINLLQERRAALISAAVTGRIDLRGRIEVGGAVREVVAA